MKNQQILEKENSNKLTLQIIDKVYRGIGDIDQKIMYLIVTRRKNHGNDEIQNKCNEYLTELYDEKYEEVQ